MTVSEVLSHVDHTQLSPTAGTNGIRILCEEALHYRTASVCVHPRYVPLAASLLGGEIAVCTVVGFPLGASQSRAKAFEAGLAIEDGAGEIDMVLSIGDLVEGRYDAVLSDIQEVRRATEGSILKVIVETCLLSEAQKSAACRIVAESGADYIKTSTGFSAGGATPEDVALFARELKGTSVRIKAAGGIRSYEDMVNFLDLGADRLGSSSAIKIVRALEENPR